MPAQFVQVPFSTLLLEAVRLESDSTKRYLTFFLLEVNTNVCAQISALIEHKLMVLRSEFVLVVDQQIHAAPAPAGRQTRSARVLRGRSPRPGGR